MNARTTFEYDGRTFRIEEINGEHFVKIGDTLRKVKLQADGTFKKGWSGRNPGTSNSTESSVKGNSKATIAPDSGLWAKLRAKVAKNLSVELENVGIIVTGKTVTVNANDVLINPRTKTNVVYALCTWSANLADWLAGNAGTMSPANSVQDSETLAAIHGTAQLLNDWHK